MGITIDITDSELAGFSDEAKRKLQQIVLAHSHELIAECQRLDSGQQSGNSGPDINRNMVEKAQIISRNDLIRTRKKWYSYLPAIVSSTSAIFVGAFYKDPFANNGQVILFACVLAIFAISSTLQFVLGARNDQ